MKTKEISVSMLSTVSAVIIITMMVYAYQSGNAEYQNIQKTSTESEISTESDAQSDDQNFSGIRTENGFDYMYVNGELYRSNFITENGELYRTDEDGKLISGQSYNYSNNLWYFFDQYGHSISGWIKDRNQVYYLNRGVKTVGWLKLPNAETSGDTWYYFNESGEMLKNTVTPDGYVLDESGRWIETDPAPENDFSIISNAGNQALSGIYIAGKSAELFMLSIAGETSGGQTSSVYSGDFGRAYGLCQFDYRYDLHEFMNWAYNKHPDLQSGFADYLAVPDGSRSLVYNTGIQSAFMKAFVTDYETCVSNQLEFIKMLYFDSTDSALMNAGIDLSARSISVSAALLSVNVNCGSHPSLQASVLSNRMSDEDMIAEIYKQRNTTLANEWVGSVRKGTTTRYKYSEPKMAYDLLKGLITVNSNLSYGGGVEWQGNIFSENDIITVANQSDGTDFSFYLDQIASGAGQSADVSMTETQPESQSEVQPGADGFDGALREFGPSSVLESTQETVSETSQNAGQESSVSSQNESENIRETEPENVQNDTALGNISETKQSETEETNAAIEESTYPEKKVSRGVSQDIVNFYMNESSS